MFTSKKKSLVSKILLGMMTTGVLCGGVFAAQAEAEPKGGDNKCFYYADAAGDTKACNNTVDESDQWAPNLPLDFFYTVGFVGPSVTNANANGNTLNLKETAEFTAHGSGASYSIYGGYVYTAGNADGNTINITSTGGTYGKCYSIKELAAGKSEGGSADKNKVNINGGNFGKGTSIYGGCGTSSASENTVNISKGLFNEGSYIRGGMAGENADKNTVNIRGGKFGSDETHGIYEIYGGRSTSSTTASANENTVNISGGTITNSDKITGGEAARKVKGNVVKISDGEVKTNEIVGGYTWNNSTEAVAEGNRVEVTGGTVKAGNFCGGKADNGTAKGNYVTLSGGNIGVNYIYGGKAHITGGRAEGNIVTIGTDLAGAVVYGGYSDKAATNNQVIVKSGNITSNLQGGLSATGTASGNKLVLEGGTIESYTILGGHTGSGEATGNIVELRGAKVIGTVQGGFADAGTAHDNIIKVYAGDLSAALLNSDKIEIYGKNLNIQHITDFKQLDFYIPKEAVNGDTLVNITETWGTELAEGTKVNAGVMAGSKLKEGDTLTLLHDAAGITNNGAVTGKLTEGVSLEHEVDIAIGANDIKATIHNNQTPPKPGPKLKEATKVLAETRAGGIAMLRSGSDLMTGKGLANAQLAADAAGGEAAGGEAAGQGAKAGAAGFTPYAVIGGDNMCYETGSYVNVRGWGLNIGMARKLHYKDSTLTIAPLVEYGRGNYDSHLEDALNTRGDGTQQYFGIGCMVKDEKKDGMYYEGGLRIGRMKGDYKGAIEGRGTGYDTESNYYAAQAGIGKVFKSGEKSKWDVYGKFFWTHQAADNGVALKGAGTGEYYDFAAVNSYRLRLGARWTQDISQGQQVYAGIAWDYEFDSDARASFKGMSTPTPSLKGSSGMLELGWKSIADAKDPLSVDLGLTGWIGKQRGVQFNAGLNWEF